MVGTTLTTLEGGTVRVAVGLGVTVDVEVLVAVEVLVGEATWAMVGAAVGSSSMVSKVPQTVSTRRAHKPARTIWRGRLSASSLRRRVHASKSARMAFMHAPVGTPCDDCAWSG